MVFLAHVMRAVSVCSQISCPCSLEEYDTACCEIWTVSLSTTLSQVIDVVCQTVSKLTG